jgi:hypothetical protein
LVFLKMLIVAGETEELLNPLQPLVSFVILE